MKNLISTIVFLAILFSLNLQSQTHLDENLIKSSQNKFSQIDKENFTKKIKDLNKRIPDRKNFQGIQKIENGNPKQNNKNQLQFLPEFPKQVIYPGEFDEVQAIIITWPYVTLDTNGQMTDQVFEGIGSYYDEKTEEFYFGPVTSFIDTLDYSPYPPIFSQLAYYINLETQVWINVWNAQDSTILKNYLKRMGYELTNYRFYVNPGNSFWYRDCGPIAFYYGNDDKIGFLDLEYYGGRPLDDELPLHIAMANDYPIFTTSIEFEGGNVLLDGMGTMVTSNAVYPVNADTYGQIFIGEDGEIYEVVKKSLKTTQVDDSLRYLFNLNFLKVLPALRYDGGTGHVDLYADMWDENRFVFTKFPDELKSFTDYTITKKNIDTLLSIVRGNGKKYRYSYIPLPKKDDGTWYKNNNDYAQLTRSYSNHLILNKAIIQPVFASEISGDKVQLKKDLDSLSAKYPGYKIYPIDVRAFDGFGGAIHCITKQIPAENPLRIYHTPVDENVPYQSEYPIEATIQNQSGILSAKVLWRYKGETEWNELKMSNTEGNIFATSIKPEQQNATIEYFIEGKSNNGKTITKPMTAPNGYYSFTFSTVSVNNSELNNTVSEFYPNPAYSTTQVGLNTPNIITNISISDINGRIIYSKELNLISNDNLIEINTSHLNEGVYLVNFKLNNGHLISRKLVVGR